MWPSRPSRYLAPSPTHHASAQEVSTPSPATNASEAGVSGAVKGGRIETFTLLVLVWGPRRCVVPTRIVEDAWITNACEWG